MQPWVYRLFPGSSTCILVEQSHMFRFSSVPMSTVPALDCNCFMYGQPSPLHNFPEMKLPRGRDSLACWGSSWVYTWVSLNSTPRRNNMGWGNGGGGAESEGSSPHVPQTWSESGTVHERIEENLQLMCDCYSRAHHRILNPTCVLSYMRTSGIGSPLWLLAFSHSKLPPVATPPSQYRVSGTHIPLIQELLTSCYSCQGWKAPIKSYFDVQSNQ